MAVRPVEFLPHRRDLAVVLKVSERIVPVTGNSDFFARQPPTVLETTLTDHCLQPGHAKVGAKSKIVLPRSDQNDIPLIIYHASLRISLNTEIAFVERIEL